MEPRPAPSHRYGRVFAAVYLGTLPVLLAGAAAVGWSDDPGWAAAPFLAGAVSTFVLAQVLGRRDARFRGRRGGLLAFSGYQLAWYHLVFGLKVPRAWHVLRTPPGKAAPSTDRSTDQRGA